LAISNLESVKASQLKDTSTFVVAAEHGGNQMAWLQNGSKPVDELGKINGVQVLSAGAMFWHNPQRQWNVLFADYHAQTTGIEPARLTGEDYTYIRE
jgi:hypothetical protein